MVGFFTVLLVPNFETIFNLYLTIDKLADISQGGGISDNVVLKNRVDILSEKQLIKNI